MTPANFSLARLPMRHILLALALTPTSVYALKLPSIFYDNALTDAIARQRPALSDALHSRQERFGQSLSSARAFTAEVGAHPVSAARTLTEAELARWWGDAEMEAPAPATTAPIHAALLAVALAFRASGPVSIVGSVALAFVPSASLTLRAYLAAEAAFFLACCATAATMSTERQAPPLTTERRRELWGRLLRDDTQHARNFASAWFLDEADLDSAPSHRALLFTAVRQLAGWEGPQAARPATRVERARWEELRLDDVTHWLAWGLYNKEVDDLLADEAHELRSLIGDLEEAAGVPLCEDECPARDRTFRPMRASLEPVRWQHRPLFYYAVTTAFVSAVTPATMGGAGYSLASVGVDGGAFRYYHRRVISDEHVPLLGAATAPSSVVVFIHGVGVGPLPYLDLLQRLEEEGTLVVAVELPMVLQQVALRPPPSPDAFAQAFAKMLVDLGVTADVPLTLVGHSLGSAYCQYLRHRLPEAHERPVRAVALLDPIACLLNHARVTSSFVYAPPRTALGAAEEYFVKRELWTANVIARHLPWYEAIVTPHDCSPETRTTIVLSGDDDIVPGDAVRRAFGSFGAWARGARVVTIDGLGHGAWLASDDAKDTIADAVKKAGRDTIVDTVKKSGFAP